MAGLLKGAQMCVKKKLKKKKANKQRIKKGYLEISRLNIFSLFQW